MPNVLYTAEAHVTGGRGKGHGRTSDGQLDVQMRLPTEMGGAGDGANPEQLFAVGYAACFEGALGVVARRAKVEVEDAAIDSQVTLTPRCCVRGVSKPERPVRRSDKGRIRRP